MSVVCVCVGGGGLGGGRECQSCIHAALGGWVMCVCGGGGGGGVGAVVQSTPTLHKNSDTLHNETLSVSLSLCLSLSLSLSLCLSLSLYQ